ncbi:MAG: hypothetical protein QOE70_4348 [Chthoniobacter sp.]|nr:hypothetical protein [Chthoniobacter sp.]
MNLSHEAAAELVAAHEMLRSSLVALNAARQLGRWSDPAHRGEDAARNSLRDIRATIRRAACRLERLVGVAAKTLPGETLILKIDRRLAR